MKNLKDEIEGKIIDILEDFEGERADEGVFVSPTAFPNAIEAITSLIEQEKERAVREFVNLCHKNEIYGDTGVVIGNFIGSNKSDLECLAEQYLAERKGE